MIVNQGLRADICVVAVLVNRAINGDAYRGVRYSLTPRTCLGARCEGNVCIKPHVGLRYLLGQEVNVCGIVTALNSSIIINISH